MNSNEHIWALVLAAGDGNRLKSLTTTAAGIAIPKQFCSLHGGDSLLDEALQRAAVVAPRSRTCAIVAAQHRRWFAEPLARLPDANVIVQPENRGTAHGILLPLLHIAMRDPEATVVLLPADHHVRDEDTLAQSLRLAADQAAARRSCIYLLGIEPNEADTELGYIVPVGVGRDGAARVTQFVEKPHQSRANALVEAGALWNVFIMAANVQALLGLYLRRFAETLIEMRAAVARGSDATTELYRCLPSADFSRDVLEGQEAVLRVVPVPDCGWTDLGTPQRVAATLQRLPEMQRALPRATTCLNLAIEYARFQFASAGRGLQGVAP
jgi:mannose-1-phosphate guanylyltransferase